MGWLALTKLFPIMQSTAPPSGLVATMQASDEPIRERWEILWDDRAVGWSESVTQRHANDSATVENHVHFEQLPVSEMLRASFAPLRLLFGSAGSADLNLSMDVVSTVKLNGDGRLAQLDSSIDMPGVGKLCDLHGHVEEGQLHVVVTGGESLGSDSRELYRGSIDFPDTGSMSDGFAPQSRLTNLYVGQRWTFQSVRPFPPNSPIQLVEARVKEERVVIWKHDLMTVHVVTYRPAGTTGLTSTRNSYGEMWVRRDGTVLRQTLTIAGMTVDFQRQVLPRIRGVSVDDRSR